ncbi:hypothetical protein B0H14DRAFT_224262 [Mycena olivaceomarginata]|nr:hypothetical protein B0H14DRAFT_224262 [Mycena olivaceomarginata]
MCLLGTVHGATATLSETATLLRVINGDRPERPWGMMLSNALWGLVNECWAQWSADRPPTDAVVKHMIEGSAPRSRSLSPFIPPLHMPRNSSMKLL